LVRFIEPTEGVAVPVYLPTGVKVNTGRYPRVSGVGGCSAVVGFTPAVNGGTLSSIQIAGVRQL
jgi:hypothetical protein